jgi:hypothetical protein
MQIHTEFVLNNLSFPPCSFFPRRCHTDSPRRRLSALFSSTGDIIVASEMLPSESLSRCGSYSRVLSRGERAFSRKGTDSSVPHSDALTCGFSPRPRVTLRFYFSIPASSGPGGPMNFSPGRELWNLIEVTICAAPYRYQISQSRKHDEALCS